MATFAPERTLKQRMGALDHANRIRVGRAAVKRDVHAGRVSVVDLLDDPPACIETMKLFDLLVSQWRWGGLRANRVLSRCGISAAKTVGGLSERQRREAIAMLEAW